MEQNKTLAVELMKLGLDENTVPDPEQWREFLKCVDAFYVQAELNTNTGAHKTEAELEKLQSKLISSARRAGMADVATSILHNVGNILNSVNVSISIIQENLNQNFYNKFLTINEMIKAHLHDLDKFFTQDEKGKLIPGYLNNLIKKIKSNHTDLRSELEELSKQINYIRDITAMQKEISGVSGVIEKVFMPELIDNAIKICNHDICSVVQINKLHIENLFISTDKSKLLQIIVNLIQNAKEALMYSSQENKTINISLIKLANRDYMQLRCEDNGVGISKDNLIKIFSYGFTTKPHGHGFGLHGSALAAKELGGKLEVTSKGRGFGAEFSLTLPLKSPERRNIHEPKEENADHSN